MLREYLSSSWQTINHKKNPSEVALVDVTYPLGYQYEALAEEVEKSGGNATILVHPFYHQKEHSINIPRSYKRAVKNVISEARERQEPVIVFEEAISLSRLVSRIPEGKYHIVKTIPGDPAPTFDELGAIGGYAFGELSNQDAVDLVTSSFRDAGVQKATVGGRYYFINERASNPFAFDRFTRDVEGMNTAAQWTEKQVFADGCVGSVITGLLKAGIEVNVSDAVSPGTSSDRLTHSEWYNTMGI